ncbi:MAG: RDD family protein [Algoriphagus aquaeductus]|uniref:RDD family protein n=1 Tax=Algoriphagus aquaeductus TaxID=475299 RepID=UPI00387934FE
MSTTTRLINFSVDSLAYFFLVMGFVWIFKSQIPKEEARSIFVIGYFVYYFFFEFAFGKTIGKMITKTKVVSEASNSRPSIAQILIRTLVRIIPIYFLSHFFIGKGLHDHFSKTILIKS